MRWFFYEPEKRGAIFSGERLARAKQDASYRTTANFIDWVARTYDKDIAMKMNTAARGGYEEVLWKQVIGKEVSVLADEWRAGK